MKKYKAVLIGFGNIAYKYALDPKFKKEHEFSTHAQVLSSYERVDWVGVIDPKIDANDIQKEFSLVQACNHLDDFLNKESVDLLVLACPSNVDRLGIIKAFRNLKGIILEKPIHNDFKESIALHDYLNQQNIKTNVSYLRRGDSFLKNFIENKSEDIVGEIINAQIIYGNGIKNNGSHLIDLSRMMIADFKKLLFKQEVNFMNNNLDLDKNYNFAMEMTNGSVVHASAINFNSYRENSFDLWGTKGRFVLTQEGSYYQFWKKKPSRFGHDFFEIDWSSPDFGKTDLGKALFNLYANLVDSIESDCKLLSPTESAIKTESIVDLIMTS